MISTLNKEYKIAVIGAINAFNMMDGIDGLAGMMALVSFGSLALLFWFNSDSYGFYVSCLLFIVILFGIKSWSSQKVNSMTS